MAGKLLTEIVRGIVRTNGLGQGMSEAQAIEGTIELIQAGFAAIERDGDRFCLVLREHGR